MNISRVIYKATGRMTRKHIMRTAEDIGKSLIQKAHKQNARLEISDINEVLIQKLGKEKASRIIISDKLEDFKQFAMKNLEMDEDLAEMTFFTTKGAAIPGGGKTKKTFFKIIPAEFESLGDLVNTISHECEHLLFQNFSFRNLMETLYIKIRGKKHLKKFMSEYSNIINEKVFTLQQFLIGISNLGESGLGGFTKYVNNKKGLLQQMGFGALDLPKLRECIQQGTNYFVLEQNNEKLNLRLLKIMRAILKDESRAYKVGGRVERSLYPNTDRATKSEMLAQLYDETISVFSKEIKTKRRNKIRRFLGLKEK